MLEGDFLEHAEYSGRRYGTLRSELDRRTAQGASVVLEIEVQGARQVAHAMPDAVRIFISPPAEEALRLRLVGRGHETPEQINARMNVAKAELAAKGRVRRTSCSTTTSRRRPPSSSASCAPRCSGAIS